MTPNFESITSRALETVTGGVDDGAAAEPRPDPTEPFTTGGSIRSGTRDQFTTGGTIEGGGPFTTGGSIRSGKRDQFTTGGTIEGGGPFTTGGSF